ncbi:hypothetical protein MMC21_004082 [Puttea exsequens]|nr:hypothetical protein [Puttea exsequens]
MAPPDLSSLSMLEDRQVSQEEKPQAKVQSHRSHDPNHNLKRSDPFKFGSRYLQPEDNVYEFNAWDHVVPDAAYHEYAETQYANQKAAPVSELDKKRFNTEPEKWWNRFYSNNTSNFFKDRKWLHQEFPILSKLTAKDAQPATILEVGAGAGNTAFPILRANENPGLIIHACDFSRKAIDIMLANPAYDSKHIQASVWDITAIQLPNGLSEASVDLVLLVFIFSALSPTQWDAAVRNIWRVLKPGGEVCFRDYGKGDLTQVRFKKGRLLEDNFYIRGDGTRVYFFEEAELRKIWGGTATACNINPTPPRESHSPNIETARMTNGRTQHVDFNIVSLGVDRRMLVNRQKQLKMYRCWMQGRFKKPANKMPD